MKSSLQFLLFQLPFDWRPPARFIVSVAVIGAITAGMTEGIFELMLRYPSHVPRSMLEVLKEYYYEEDQAFIQYLPDCSKYDDELTYTLRPGSCRFIGGRGPRRGGNSYLRYPCLKNFFHNCLITNDLKATKA